MRTVYKNLCPAKISASIMAANMWKNSLKNVESDKKKFIRNLTRFFLQRNGTYFLNKPRRKCTVLNPIYTIETKRIKDIFEGRVIEWQV